MNVARLVDIVINLETSCGVAAVLPELSVYWRITTYLFILLFFLGVVERVLVWWKKGPLKGPYFFFPFIGSIFPLVRDPYCFWEQQRKWSFVKGISWNYIFGQFTLFATDSKISKFFLSNIGNSGFQLRMHYNGKKLVGDNNIAFKSGEELKMLRKSFLPLFTRRALGMYISIQERIIQEHVSQWLAMNKEHMEMRNHCRTLNLLSSQVVFVGPYIHDQQQFCNDYLCITSAILAVPINLPGTLLWRGIRARKRILLILNQAVKDSKQKMKEGNKPKCLLDFWCQRINAEVEHADKKGVPPPYYCDDEEMASVMMDFLFASQDASTASLVQTLALMADNPDVMEKVQQEQARVNPDSKPLTYEMVQELVYTRQVVKEILRYNPPAPMIMEEAMADIRVCDDFIIPKGTYVIPSIRDACRQGFSCPHKFDPDRMGPERKEDLEYAENFLVFGIGPHKCVGREYAINHITVFLAVLSAKCTWVRKRTTNSDKLAYLPCIYPADCLITLTARK